MISDPRESLRALVEKWRTSAAAIAKNARGTVLENMLMNRELTFRECADELAAALLLSEAAPPATWTPTFPFIHWSKDEAVPYYGCTCCSCEAARKPLPSSPGSGQPTDDKR